MRVCISMLQASIDTCIGTIFKNCSLCTSGLYHKFSAREICSTFEYVSVLYFEQFTTKSDQIIGLQLPNIRERKSDRYSK